MKPKRYPFECRRPTLDRSSYLRTDVGNRLRAGVPYQDAVAAVAARNGISRRVLVAVLRTPPR